MRHLHAISLVVLLLGGMSACTAQKLTRYDSRNIVLSKANFIDSIAIDWERGQVYVPLQINGESYRFLLDTGAGQSVVYDDMPIAGTTFVGRILAHDAVGRTDTVQVVQLPPLQLGGLTLRGCRATVQHRAVRRQNVDGIIGFDLVNSGLGMKIDVQNHCLILTDRRNFFDGEGGQELRYRLNYHVPYVEVQPLGRYREQVLFDTGSRQLFAMNKSSFDTAYSQYPISPDFTVEGRSVGRHAIGHSGTEARGEVAFLLLNGLRLGRQVFSGLHTLTTQGESHLGAALLRYGTVSFSPRRKRMFFRSYTAGDTCRVDNRQMEIAFVSDRGLPSVGLVWEGGEPYRRGFREGDIIQEIDHKPVFSFAQFSAWGFEPGREYVFTVQDSQGRRHEIRWERLPRITK